MPPQAADSSPATRGTLVLGVVGEPPSLDPEPGRDPEPSRWLGELAGSWRLAERTPGLEAVYEPKAQGTLLRRLRVRFVQTLDIALELLARGRLDAAVLPSAVNLLERLDERGLQGGAASFDEVIYLDMRGNDLPREVRASLAAWSERRSLDEILVRELGRPVSTLHPERGRSRGPFAALSAGREPGTGNIKLAAPIGDELLAMIQRALHDDWEQRGFEVDVLSIDWRTFYGGWATDPPVDIALRRGGGPGLPSDRAAFETLDAIPLFQVPTVIAWRDGVHGIDLLAPGGPFAASERWWVGDG